MKKYAVLMIMNIAVVLLATRLFFTDKNETGALTYRFTMIYPQAWDEQWQQFPDVFDLEGANIRSISFGETKEEDQIAALKKAIYSHADGIITVGSSTSEKLAAAINEAEEAGIPVVLVDSDLPDTQRSGYVGADNRIYGQKAGEDMEEATGGRAKIGIIVSGLDNPNQSERVEGFCEKIRSCEEMEVVQILECEADRMKVRKRMQEMLKEYPQIDALYCTDSVSSEMAGEILQSMGYGSSDMRVVCSDMSDEIWKNISEGRYYSSVVQNVYEQKNLAAAYLKSWLNGEKQQKEAVYTEIVSIREDFDYEAWAASGKNGEAVWEDE